MEHMPTATDTSTPPADGVQRYEIKIVATGEVHDAEGNLLNTVPIEATAMMTEDEVREQIARMESARTA